MIQTTTTDKRREPIIFSDPFAQHIRPMHHPILGYIILDIHKNLAFGFDGDWQTVKQIVHGHGLKLLIGRGQGLENVSDDAMGFARWVTGPGDGDVEGVFFVIEDGELGSRGDMGVV